MVTLRRCAPFALAALFAASGTLHLQRPDVYAAIVPRVLPDPYLVVRLSGVAELACAAGLATRRGWAAGASAVLLVAVFPANVQHALDVLADPASSSLAQAAVICRLPLQAPLIWAALQGRRG